jgi:hypothetical protein
MEYKQAKDIRKQSFGSLLSEQEGGLGSSISKTISLKSQATMTGIKEKFDPMNIAKAIAGKTGAAMYGKLFGRSKEDLSYFTGAKFKKTVPEGEITSESSPNKLLGLIFEELVKSESNKRLQEKIQQNIQEENDSEELRKHELLIRAITGRKKPEEKKKAKEKVKEAEKPKPKPEEKKVTEKTKEAPKETKTPAKEAPKETKTPAKEAPKETPKVEKAPPKEAPKQPEKVPAKEAPKEVPKEAPKPPAPKVEPKTPAVTTAAKVATGAAIVGAPIGALSAQFESSKAGAGAIGYDSTGGTSYGTYQLASKKGVVKEFLSYMSNINPEWTKTLLAAGEPDTGSQKGDFPEAWKKIAKENPKEFGKIQHDFIELKHYKPTVKALAKINYDVENQPAAIKDVVWSTAVQHGSGGAASIFKQAIQESGGVDAKPETIISNVYKIRRTKFGSSTDAVRASVNKRFDTENQLALNMLNDSGTQIDKMSKENKELKQASAGKNSSSQITQNNTNVIQKNVQVNNKQERVDDTNAYLAKVN